jgi:hypothetical protein
MDEPGPHEYTAGLRVFSERLRFVELEARLGEPTRGHDIGDPVSRRRPDSPKRRHAYWTLESSIERTRPLDEHIDELLAFAEKRRDVFASLRRDCKMDIFCGVFSGVDAQGGFSLEPSVSRRLGELQLPVVFDIN